MRILFLVKKGHDLTVVTKSHGEKSLYRGIKIKRIEKTPDNWFEKFYVWIWFWKNKQLIKNADIVHAHDVFYWYLPFRFMFPRKKVFITFHGYESYPVRKRAIIVRRISELLSNGNICVGDFIKKCPLCKRTHRFCWFIETRTDEDLAEREEDDE